jgi:hypothetical protein
MVLRAKSIRSARESVPPALFDLQIVWALTCVAAGFDRRCVSSPPVDTVHSCAATVRSPHRRPSTNRDST